jgi:hypothetical protein
MDPLHVCIALGPLAMYLLLIGAINLSRRPMVTTGGRDVAALGVAISGLVAAGPMELFLPDSAADRFGPYAWLLMLALYALSVALVVLLLRPRIVIYNISVEQLRPALAEVVSRLDPEARWAGESLVMPHVGVHLHIEPSGWWRNVQLVSSGPHQSYLGWRRLEADLAAELRTARVSASPYGASLVAFGLLLAMSVTYWLATRPEQVADGLTNMLRLQEEEREEGATKKAQETKDKK